MTLAKAYAKSFLRYNALVAQSVECILGKDEVSSSILLKGSRNYRGLRVVSVSLFSSLRF
ncbi:hypothetical protein KL86DES1_11006 [uncultured Desulfovibrio sp.]|uniref:Uncharacterized protein n=1 Tax=uncultured Desulfovibrio sp. TaxID=167968 RepID=A0A212L1H8_9BACT|nr:hypothetical protein KL86DES1_11006 [uncultured Desulfovibrio sp.]VZH32877.1 conserved protein of unknown function [Desulfovibrio sp. 86]